MLASLDQMLSVRSLPYSEYWIPLAIGLGIGFMFLVVAKTFSRAGAAPPPAPAAKYREYDPFAQGSPTENRKSFRRAGNPVDVQYALADSKKQVLIGWVFDRSVGGLGLVTAEEHKLATLLVVRPVRGSDVAPWIEVEVRSCRPAAAGGFELGCQFVKTPPWSVLLLFG